VVKYLSDGDTLLRQGLKHICNQILKRRAEERSALEPLVFFPKLIKFLRCKQLPKVIKAALHLKWRAAGEALKKGYAERIHVCRHSLVWLVLNNFGSLVTNRASLLVKKAVAVFTLQSQRQTEISDLDVKIAVK
jgi:hypothetical protein